MKEMLDVINKIDMNLSDFDNQIIADYLTGKGGFKKVAELFRSQSKVYVKQQDIIKISSLVASDKSLLPRVSRFMDIITHLLTSWSIIESYENITSYISFEEIYASCGAAQMFEKALYLMVTDYLRWSLRLDKIFGGLDSFNQKLIDKYSDELIKKFPPLLMVNRENYLSFEAVLYIKVLFYNSDPVKYAKFADDIISDGVLLFSNNLPDYAFDLIRSEPFFAGNTYIDKAEKIYAKKRNAVTEKGTVYAFYLAFFSNRYQIRISGKNPAEVIVYLHVLSEIKNIDCTKVFDAVGIACNHNSFIIERYDVFEQWAEQGLFPKEVFIGAFVNVLFGTQIFRLEFKRKFLNFIHENEVSAVRVLEYSREFSVKSALLYSFWKDGKHLDKLPEIEERLAESIVVPQGNAKNNELQTLINWFLGRVDVTVDTLPKFSLRVGFYSSFINSEVIAFTLMFSGTAKRILQYLFYNKSEREIISVLCALSEIYEYSETGPVINNTDIPEEDVAVCLAQLYGYNLYQSDVSAICNDFVARYLNEYLKKHNAETIFSKATALGKAVLLEFQYSAVPNYSLDFALSCLGESSKSVREKAIVLLQGHPELTEKVTALLTHKKKVFRESAERLINLYNNTDISKPADADTSDEAGGEFNVLKFVTKHFPSTGNSTVKWADFENLPKVRFADNGADSAEESFADEKTLKCYLYIFMTSEVSGDTVRNFRSVFNREDIRDFAKAVYRVWKKENAPAKRKQVLTFAAVNADDAFINHIHKDLKEWADASRGALAAEAIKAIAKNGSDISLMLVDSVSKKFPNRQVKRAAEEAFANAAKDLGIDPEVLADRIIPNLGFNARGERELDYGTRKFIVRLTSKLAVELRNNENKVIKSLPAPNSKDDEQKAKSAKEELAFVKKQLKNVVGIQSFRLESALSDCRTWFKPNWEKIFVQNPVMTNFAVGLVWGIYDESKTLLNSFRYLEDGTFTDVDENDVEIPDTAQIGLCHPLDLGTEITEKWAEQLSDYDITQPVEQIARKVFTLPEKKINTLNLADKSVLAITLLTKLTKFGWLRGAVEDAGCYCRFYKEDRTFGVGVILSFEGAYVGGGNLDDSTNLEHLCFYHLDDDKRAEFNGYYEVPENKKINFADLPARFYSEVLYDLTRAIGEFDIK